MATPNESTLQNNPNPVAEPTDQDLIQTLGNLIQQKGLKTDAETALRIPALRNMAREMYLLQKEQEKERLRLVYQKQVNEQVDGLVRTIRNRIAEVDELLMQPVAHPELMTELTDPSADEVTNQLVEFISILRLSISTDDITRIDVRDLVRKYLKKNAELKMREAALEHEDLLSVMQTELKSLRPEPVAKQLENEPLWKRVAMNKQSECIEKAKELMSGMVSDDFFKELSEQSLRNVLSGARGFLAGKRRNALISLDELKKTKSSDGEKVRKLKEECIQLQKKIDRLSFVYTKLYGEDIEVKANHCPTEIYADNLRRFELAFGLQRYDSKAVIVAKPAPKKVLESRPSAEVIAQRETEKKIYSEILNALATAGCEETSRETMARRVMKKCQGTAQERLTEAAVGQAVHARIASSIEEQKQAQQTAIMYARAAELDSDQFEALVEMKIAEAKKESADKPYATVAKPVSENQARRQAEQARKAREQKKQEKGGKGKKQK